MVEDLVKVFFFFVLDFVSYVNGVNFIVDGGFGVVL